MRKFVPILLILAVLSCTKRQESATVADRMENGAPGRSAAVQLEAVAQQTQGSPGPVAHLKDVSPQRMIIRNANLSITVDDTAATIEKITAAGESVGGYVSDSKVWRDGEQLRGTITLRLPADRLTAALAVLRKMAVRVNSESIGSQEVTQEYTDLASQLRNLEAAEVELRQLMSTIRERSKKASEVLEMYQQLSTIRSQIEAIKGRMRYLSEMSSFASVQVDVVPNALQKPVVEPGVWQPLVIVKEATRALVGAMQAIASVAIWFIIYVLPMLVLFGMLAFAVSRAVRRFGRRGQTAA